MALVLKDRVQETVNSPGTGDLSLLGAVTGFQSFSSAIGNNNTCYYAIADQGGANWEVGLGTYVTSGNVLQRTTVLSSSAGGTTKANFASGVQNVFVTYPAEKSVNLDSLGVANIADADITDASITNATLTNATVSATPVAATDVANKTYVDTLVSSGVHFHQPVRVESTINLNATYNNGTAGVGATLTNAGARTALVVDGVAVAVNDRVLVYQQTNQTQNGVYVVTDIGTDTINWILTRSDDTDTYGFDSPNALSEGSTFFVQQGTTGAGETYTCNTPGVITFGTTNITFAQISSAQIYSAGTGLNLTGTTFSLATAYGDTLNPYASKTANFVLAAPNGSAGVPTFRAIVAADVPTLNQNTTGNAATATTATSATTATTATNQSGGTVSATTGAFTAATASTAFTNGALVVTGGVGIGGATNVNNIVNRITGNGNSAWLQQDGTGRVHWYWNTYGGVSPVFTNANEDASALTLHITASGAGGSFFHRSASGVGQAAGAPITWTTTIYTDLNSFTWKGNTVLRSDNYNTYSPTLTGTGASGTWGISVTGNAATATTATTATTANALNAANAYSIDGSFTSSDLNTRRPASPTTGYLYFGNTGTRYVGFDGTNFVTTMPMNFSILGSAATATNQSGGTVSATTGSFSGVATFSAGTVTAPAITTTGDTNTGIFFPAADTIAFTEGGVEAMRITSAGGISFGSSGTAFGTSGQVLQSNGNAAPTWVTPTTSGGTVTSVSGTGTVNGLTLTGTVTSSGSLTLGGSLSGSAPSLSVGSATTAGAASTATTAGSATTAGNVTGVVAIANGGTGSTTAATARTALGAAALQGTASVFGGAKFSLSGTTLTITTV